MRSCIMAVGLCLFAVGGIAQAQVEPDPAIDCPPCGAWNAPLEPFQVFGNTYYVGTAELGAILVVADGGLILLDGALPQSAPLIDASIRALGFQPEDIRLIVNSHAHFDHAGAIAYFQLLSGATVVTSAAGAEALRLGGPTPDDPQFSLGGVFPAVPSAAAVGDGEALRVGDVEITPHYTPGHTPGSTTWTWVACEGEVCLNVVYADSLNAVSADEYRFSEPAVEDRFRQSIQTVADLPCDILLAVHPGFTGMRQKLEARTAQPAADPFVDPDACRQYAATALETLEERLAREQP